MSVTRRAFLRRSAAAGVAGIAYGAGEFGIRLEDCLYITDSGAKFFTQPSPAIDQPFA